MRGKPIGGVLLPVLLAAGLGACANNAVQPGIVGTSYGNSPAYSSNTTNGPGAAPAQAYAQPGETGRVVSINDVNLRGSGGSGSGNGPMIGGLLGGLGGIAIGASGGRGVGGGVIGGVLGAVGGAIAGSIFDRSSMGSGGRGIEVTVQKDNGQTVTLAQRDDGDVQLGDRVQIVQSRDGVAKAVRDNNRQPDYQTYQPAPQDYRQPQYNPPPQDYRQSGGYSSGSYGQPQDYRTSGYSGGGQGSYSSPQEDYRQARYSPPASSTHTYYPNSNGGYQNGSSQDYSQGNPQPQNDPRYGNIE